MNTFVLFSKVKSIVNENHYYSTILIK